MKTRHKEKTKKKGGDGVKQKETDKIMHAR